MSHQTDEHGHEHHSHDNGHNHAAAPGAIPESSWQDKLLLAIAAGSLAALVYIGSLWAFAIAPPAHHEGQAEPSTASGQETAGPGQATGEQAH